MLKWFRRLCLLLTVVAVIAAVWIYRDYQKFSDTPI